MQIPTPHSSTPLKLRFLFLPPQCRRDSWQVYIHEPSTWLENGSLLLCWAVVLARLLIVFSSTYQNWSFNPAATNAEARESFRDLENLGNVQSAVNTLMGICVCLAFLKAVVLFGELSPWLALVSKVPYLLLPGHVFMPRPSPGHVFMPRRHHVLSTMSHIVVSPCPVHPVLSTMSYVTSEANADPHQRVHNVQSAVNTLMGICVCLSYRRFTMSCPSCPVHPVLSILSCHQRGKRSGRSPSACSQRPIRCQHVDGDLRVPRVPESGGAVRRAITLARVGLQGDGEGGTESLLLPGHVLRDLFRVCHFRPFFIRQQDEVAVEPFPGVDLFVRVVVQGVGVADSRLCGGGRGVWFLVRFFLLLDFVLCDDESVLE